MVYVIFNIILVLIKKMNVEEAYSYIMICMTSDVAKIVVIGEIMLIVSYCAIIWITNRNRGELKQIRHSKQKNSTSTLILCIGIVFVFIVFTTPFVVVNVTTWNYPLWLDLVSVFLLPLEQVCNSILYLAQKYRSRRTSNISRVNRQGRVEPEDARL